MGEIYYPRELERMIGRDGEQVRVVGRHTR